MQVIDLMGSDDIKKKGGVSWFLGIAIPIAISLVVDILLWRWLRSHGVEFRTFIIWFLGIALVLGVAVFYIRLPALILALLGLLFLAPIYPLGIVAFGLFWLLSRLMRVFDRTGKGRAVGGFGLCLAGLGFIGEAYQVYMLHDDVTTRLEYITLIVLLCLPFVLIGLFIRKLVRKNKTPEDFRRMVPMERIRRDFRKRIEEAKK